MRICGCGEQEGNQIFGNTLDEVLQNPQYNVDKDY